MTFHPHIFIIWWFYALRFDYGFAHRSIRRRISKYASLTQYGAMERSVYYLNIRLLFVRCVSKKRSMASASS